MRQEEEIKELFREKIRRKIAKDKEKIQQRIDNELPSWISWVAKPLANFAFEQRCKRDCSKGEGGEDKAAFNFWLFLSKEWILINDVVLEPESDEFVQIDHVLIGPPGIFIVETKAWDGAYLGYRDNWKRKEGNSWVRCESPTKQNLRHVKLIKKWLSVNVHEISPALLEKALFPVVLFTKAKWLKVNDCSMPVFDSGFSLSIYIRRKTKETLLSNDQIDKIAETIVNAKPYTASVSEASHASNVSCDILDSTFKNVQIKKAKDGRFYVKVFGDRGEAQRVWEMLKKEGKNPEPIKHDRFSENAWFFYV